MGFFGGLFEKKECAICGGEIGLLGNRKLEDGNMCKSCAAKLSPWFSDRRNSTVAEINEQLAYREANKEKVAAFRTTRSLGEGTKVLLDEDNGVFMVTSARNLEEANPDVMAFSDVTGCDWDVSDRKQEITRPGKDGKQESYNPPRYRYYYDFYFTIQVRNPYFDDIRIRLNTSSVEIEDLGFSRPPMSPPRGAANRPGAATRVAGGAMRFAAGMSNRIDPERDPDYRRYVEMGEELKEVLMNARQQGRDEAAAAATPKAAVTCPYCGATTTPDASGCCEYCGGAVND